MGLFSSPRLVRVFNRLRSSYWFVPGLIIVSSCGLAYFMLELDKALGLDYVMHLGWVYTRDPDGARALLSVVSQSMITVAGVVFSITVVALTMASNQFGTRVLKSFARDTGNQIVLGTFLGTFLYCLIVMRRVEQNFVPSLSVAGAITLAMAGVLVLVYFIHHVISEIQGQNVLASVVRDLNATIDVLFPDQMGDPAPSDEVLTSLERHRINNATTEVRSEREGYVRTILSDKLIKAAGKEDAVVRLLVAPGEFITSTTVVARVWAAGGPHESLIKRVRAVVEVGDQRTYDNDVAFGMQQLGLIAVRSLSPAINAIGTAMDAIDRLSACFIRLGGRKVPSQFGRDRKGNLRVVTSPPSFELLLQSVLEPLRHSAHDNASVLKHAMKALGRAASQCSNVELRRVLLYHLDQFAASAKDFSLDFEEADVRELRDRLHPDSAA